MAVEAYCIRCTEIVVSSGAGESLSLSAFFFFGFGRVVKPTEPDDQHQHNHKSLGVSPVETIWSILRHNPAMVSFDGRRGHRWAISQYVSGLMDTHSKHDTFDAQSSITSIQKCSCWPGWRSPGPDFGFWTACPACRARQHGHTGPDNGQPAAGHQPTATTANHPAHHDKNHLNSNCCGYWHKNPFDVINYV